MAAVYVDSESVVVSVGNKTVVPVDNKTVAAVSAEPTRYILAAEPTRYISARHSSKLLAYYPPADYFTVTLR